MPHLKIIVDLALRVSVQLALFSKNISKHLKVSWLLPGFRHKPVTAKLDGVALKNLKRKLEQVSTARIAVAKQLRANPSISIEGLHASVVLRIEQQCETLFDDFIVAPVLEQAVAGATAIFLSPEVSLAAEQLTEIILSNLTSAQRVKQKSRAIDTAQFIIEDCVLFAVAQVIRDRISRRPIRTPASLANWSPAQRARQRNLQLTRKNQGRA